ncbi:MAG TPA: transglycosylase SLT domain-containing protein [Candidatus Binatia bacterium]|jgi:soluble lytic murein transglycosylase
MGYRIITILLVAALGALPRAAHSQTDEQHETFATAYALYTNGKSADAKGLFEKTIDLKFRLADYSLYYLAAINFSESNWLQARQLLAQLKQGFPQSIWIHAAALLQAKIEMAEKRYASATETLRQLRAETLARSDITDEAVFLQAQIQEALEDPLGAHALYNELRDRSPNSRWSTNARKAQAKLREAFPDIFALRTMDSLAREADRLARERQFNDAAALYKKLLNNASDADARLRYLVKLTNLYLSARSRNEAIPSLESIAREFPENAEAPKALYQIGQIYWNRHDNAQALEYFKLILQEYPTSDDVDRARFAAADIHEYFNRLDEAIQLYSDTIKFSPKSQVRDDAAWRLAWLYYRNNDLADAVATFKLLAKLSGNVSLGTAALYWQARVAEKSGDSESARQLYRRVINSATESYYQMLSVRALQRLGEVADEPKMVRPSAAEEPDPPMTPDSLFHIARARALSSLSLRPLAVAELDEVSRRTKSLGRLRALLMREYFHNGAYGRALQLANQLPTSSSERDLYRYPLAFWDMIQQKAQERELDPYLVLALIRQESLFDARARSPAAAMGLMQLIPPTAARVAKQLGMQTPSQETLVEPELNLTLGTQYLKDLLQRYSNNWYKAIAAYNAGEAAVDRWEREIVTDDIEEFVERIPYVETRGYVKLVLRNHEIYKRLYDTQK